MRSATRWNNTASPAGSPRATSCPESPYAREIIRGIRDCQIIVLIYTNDSNASEHVLNEIDKAFNYGKVIIPSSPTIRA